jgi:D-hydroxyproline dehydrogenase subunit beta
VSACEVAVVGAGLVGAAVASELAARGVDVVLLDAGEVSGGTTGLGEGNVLVGDKEPGPELELTLAGLALFDELDADLGDRARVRRKGALVVHPDAATWAAEPGRVAALRAAGAEAELLDAAEVRAREPRLEGPLHGASFFPRDLQCAPRPIARALAARVARLRTRCRVDAVAVEDGRVTGVRTEDGRLGADAVVVAAGPWSRALCEDAGLALPLEPRKGQLLRLAGPRDDGRPWLRHKVVEAGYLGSVASAGAGLEVTTVLETTWEGDVLVGSSRERRGFDLSVQDDVGDAMLERAARLAPGVRGLTVAAAWAGLRPWLPDRRPAIGPSHAVPGLWVATGHEGAGVALGPVTGRVVAQALCGEAPLVALEPFAPDRFAAAAAGAGRRGAGAPTPAPHPCPPGP